MCEHVRVYIGGASQFFFSARVYIFQRTYARRQREKQEDYVIIQKITN